jgi:hypothetical protein
VASGGATLFLEFEQPGRGLGPFIWRTILLYRRVGHWTEGVAAEPRGVKQWYPWHVPQLLLMVHHEPPKLIGKFKRTCLAQQCRGVGYTFGVFAILTWSPEIYPLHAI